MRSIIIFIILLNSAFGEGIKKDTTLDSGIVVNHFDIHSAKIDYMTPEMCVTLLIYKDLATKTAGKQYVNKKLYCFDIPTALQDKSLIFTKLKTHIDFQGATDD